MGKICWMIFTCLMFCFLIVSNYKEGDYSIACIDSIVLGMSLDILIEYICDYHKKKPNK